MPKFKNNIHFDKNKLKSIKNLKDMLSEHETKRASYSGDKYFLQLSDVVVIHSFYEEVERILEAVNEYVLGITSKSKSNWHQWIIDSSSKFHVGTDKVFTVEDYSNLIGLKKIRNKYVRELPKDILGLDTSSYFLHIESLLPKVENLVNNSNSVTLEPVKVDKPKESPKPVGKLMVFDTIKDLKVVKDTKRISEDIDD